MKRKVFVLILLIVPFYLYSQISPQFRIIELSVKKESSNQYSVKIQVESSNVLKAMFEGSEVPISTEKYIVKGQYPDGKIMERDFLYSMINFDINNDNDLKDTYILRRKNRKYYLNSIPLNIILVPKKFNNFTVFSYYNNKGIIRSNSIAGNGKEFIVYNLDYNKKIITIGIDDGNKIPIKGFHNPNLQIMICKIVDSSNSKLNFSFSGEKNYSSYVNEKIFENQGDSWVGINWIIKELPVNKGKVAINCSINNITPPFVVIGYVNYSLGDGMRMRSVAVKSYVR